MAYPYSSLDEVKIIYLIYMKFPFKGVCETGYTGTNCDQCDTAFYGDGITCSRCRSHQTTLPSQTATTAEDCELCMKQNYIVVKT